MLKGMLGIARHVGEVATKTSEDEEASTYRVLNLGNGPTERKTLKLSSRE
jgi:alkylated DNA nucleotide flippase Atl1